jgi:uncharacterized protein (DUF2345 family)
MSNTDGAGVTGEVSTMQEPKKESPKKWTQPHQSDARKAKSTGSYPDYFSWKTRSGHVLQLDDTKGGETVTLQHRGGTAVQMAPDGSMHVTAHNGKYEITFGENRVTISGAQDITVKGDASFRVYGDYNVTCQKDYNLTVLGNFNLTAKNHNRQILGNLDTQARNENKKLMGSSSKIARGAIAYVAKGSVTHASQSDQIFLGGAAGANLWAKKGNITQNIEEEGNFHSEAKDGEYHVKAKKAIKVQSTDETMDFKSKNEFTMTSTDKSGKITTKQDMGIESQNSGVNVKAQNNIGLQSTSGDIQAKSTAGNVEVTAQQSLDLRASQKASLSAPTTYVSGDTTTNIKGGTSVNVDGPSALNLNGGMSQVMSALGLQMNFNFGSGGDASGETGSSRGVHAPDRPANRDEADNWA